MPTPLPTPDQVDLDPPTDAEVLFISRGLATAASDDNGLTELQTLMLGALTEAMTGRAVDFGSLEPIAAEDFAAGLARRNDVFRTRLVQIMELGHMILPEPSIAVADSIIEFAKELSVSDDCVVKAREVAEGSRQLVAADFDRNAYLTGLDLSDFTPLRTPDDKTWAWTNTVVNDDLASRWRNLGALAPGTLGRGVHDFYVARGFRFPGEEGSAPPLLAQHDWVHVIADYGSRVESELEVFGFIARASDDPGAFALLAMVVNLFQSGQLERAAGLFTADPGHLATSGMPARLADALRRGALCDGSIDFLAVDYFSMADLDVREVRSHFGVPEKSSVATASGSVGPWDPGGMSPYQLAAGEALAAAQRRSYDSYGASAD